MHLVEPAYALSGMLAGCAAPEQEKKFAGVGSLLCFLRSRAAAVNSCLSLSAVQGQRPSGLSVHQMYCSDLRQTDCSDVAG